MNKSSCETIRLTKRFSLIVNTLRFIELKAQKQIFWPFSNSTPSK